MDKIDQYLHLIDDIASSYGKILNFSFFCKDIHDFAMRNDENCDVGRFVKGLIKNIKSTRLEDQKKNFLFIIAFKERTFVFRCLNFI